MNSIDITEHVINYANREGPGRSPGKGIRNRETGSEALSEFTSGEIRDILEKLNSNSGIINEKISFRYHEGTERIIVSVINEETEEVIREIPSREMIRLLEHLQDYIGILIDERR